MSISEFLKTPEEKNCIGKNSLRKIGVENYETGKNYL